MFDYRVSKHPHFDEACRAFALRHNMVSLAEKAGIRVQTLRNKLNPEQPHHLTCVEVLLLTDLTEDATLMDGMLSQLQCLPCVPLNELSSDKLAAYTLSATAAVGQVAAVASSGNRLTAACKNTLVQSANAGVRCLALAALAVHSRIQGNPTMASTLDAVSGAVAGML